VPFSWKKVVKSLDLAICYSEFGKNVLKEFMPFTSIDMIHLGVDRSVYKPIKDKSGLKQKYGLENKFVIGCIARNQIRKRLDKLIEGFALFAKNNKNAHLYLKTEERSQIGYDIPDLIEYYTIGANVTVDQHDSKEGYSEEKLAELYNMFDVYVQTAGAEGFGIPLVEAMSCGTPVIAVDYSACSEIVGRNGILLKPCFHRIVDMASVEQVSIDTSELAEKLELLHRDTKFRRELGKKGRESSRKFSWSNFTGRWEDVLSHVKWE